MKSDYDAIIVGAGPAGSTAAILLAQAGWSVALVEQHPFPRRKVCGECIAATNLPLLDALGIGSAFDAVAGPELRKVGLFVGQEKLVADLPPLAGSQHPWGRALGREHLDTLLLERAAASGADVWQPWRVKRSESRSDHGKTVHMVKSHSSSTATLSASVMIAANGSWGLDPFVNSPVRREHRNSDLLAFKGTYLGSPLPRGLLPVLGFPGGYGGMVIGDNQTLTLAFCIRRDALHACRQKHPGLPAALAAQAYVAGSCAGVRDALRDTTMTGAWLAVGPIHPGIRSAWRRDGIFAIGNAAGEAHPILGEGISMAIQSAWLLSKFLVRHRTDVLAGHVAATGRSYARQWKRSFSGRIRVAATFAHIAMRPGVMTALVPVIKRLPAILSIGARLGAKVRPAVSP